MLETKGKGDVFHSILFAMGKLDGKMNQIHHSFNQQIEMLAFNLKRMERKMEQLEERIILLCQKINQV